MKTIGTVLGLAILAAVAIPAAAMECKGNPNALNWTVTVPAGTPSKLATVVRLPAANSYTRRWAVLVSNNAEAGYDLAVRTVGELWKKDRGADLLFQFGIIKNLEVVVTRAENHDVINAAGCVVVYLCPIGVAC